MHVNWGTKLSSPFTANNSVKQVDFLSPLFIECGHRYSGVDMVQLKS